MTIGDHKLTNKCFWFLINTFPIYYLLIFTAIKQFCSNPLLLANLPLVLAQKVEL